MNSRFLPYALYASLLLPAAAHATPEVSVRGYAEARGVMADGERSWIDHGQGKLGFSGTASPEFHGRLEGLVSVVARLDPDWSVIAQVRASQDQDTPVDILEGFVQWKPVPRSAWYYRAKAGAFFPPISLENDGLGWTPLHTLSSSAINSWIGEELRTLGGEVTLGHAWSGQRAELVLGLFAANDPTGVMLAFRGWALHDRWTTLNASIQLPDDLTPYKGPRDHPHIYVFQELDGRPGLYAGVEYGARDGARVRALWYNNFADTRAETSGAAAWKTRFVALGAQAPLHWSLTLTTQFMSGNTTVFASDFGNAVSVDFRSAYAMLERPVGPVDVAARIDWFENNDQGRGVRWDEDGHALTGAVVWRPAPAHRLAAEVLRIESFREDRVFLNLPRSATETQVQLSWRWFFGFDVL